MPASVCNVVIPNWNGMRWLPGCLESLAKQDFNRFDITIVDNGSTDGSVEWIREKYPQVKLICNSCNTGFAAAVNQGIHATDAEYVVLLNSDTRPRRDWLRRLVETMDAVDENVGVLASKMLLYGDESKIENAGDIFSWYGETLKRGYGEDAGLYCDPGDVFSACAGAALYRRCALEDAGLFDERFFAYLEDVDVGLRLNILGWRCRYVPQAEVLHHGHASGLKKAGYVRLVARNRLILFFKNIPGRLLLRNLHRILYGQWYFFLVYRHPLIFMHGVCEVLLMLPRLRRECRQLWERAALSPPRLDARICRRKAMKPIWRAVVEIVKN